MKDEGAIRLFVRDGGVAGEWHAQDEVTRMHYRKAAMLASAKDTAEDTLKRFPRIMNALATQENSDSPFPAQ